MESPDQYLQRAIAEAVDRRGAEEVALLLDLSVTSVLRLAHGMTVRRATRSCARARLFHLHHAEAA